MVRKVTLSGGVLDGKSFLVADDAEALIHHAAHGGQYNLVGAFGEWAEYGVATVALTADTSALDAALEANPSLGRPVALPAYVENAIGRMEAKLTGLLPNAPEPTGLARMVAKAAEGYRVLIVARKRGDAVELLRSCVDLATEAGPPARVLRSKGKERITFESGGMIAPIGLTYSPAGSRGISADVLYLVNVSKDDAALVDVIPSIATSDRASIVVHGEA